MLVAVKACAINYPDVLIIEDKYQMQPAAPVRAGGRGRGRDRSGRRGRDRLGAGGPGDRRHRLRRAGRENRGGCRRGSIRLPEGRSFEDGAALLLTYATTIHALLDRGHLKQGQTLLVLGAAGGVGLAAIELGKAFGAIVVAAVSSEAKAEAAKAAGADTVLVYPRAPFDKDQSKALAEQFKAAVGPLGADVIYDPVGGDYAEPALRSIGWEGRYLVVGFPAGIPRLPLNLTLLKSCDVCGVFWGAFAARDPHANQAHVERLFRLWAEGRIAPRVTEHVRVRRWRQGDRQDGRARSDRQAGGAGCRVAPSPEWLPPPDGVRVWRWTMRASPDSRRRCGV